MTQTEAKPTTIIEEVDALVVGGGVSGITSFALMAESFHNTFDGQTKNKKKTLVLVEAATDCGGCIRDATWSPTCGYRPVTIAGEERADQEAGFVVPTGSVEINPTQDRVLELCRRFGIECDSVRYTDCAIVNGERCYVDDDQIQGFPSTREEGEKFRFVGDFESTDEKRYAEFCSQEVFDAYNYYPKKGLSLLLKKLLRHVNSEYADATDFAIQLQSLVTSVTYDGASKKYHVTVEVQNDGEEEATVKHFSTPSVVLAIPPKALAGIAGAPCQTLVKEGFVYDSKGIPVTIITMWFDNLWWKDASFERIWSKYNPLLHVELFGGEEQRNAKAIRASFADGSASERFKKEAFNKDGQPSAQALEEMMHALQDFFPGVAIPEPAFVHVEYFPSAWHFEHMSAQTDLWTKQKLAMDLSQLNQQAVLGGGLHLVGEAYNPQRVWVQGAIESVMLSLMPKYVLPFIQKAKKGASWMFGTELPKLGTAPIPVVEESTSNKQQEDDHNATVVNDEKPMTYSTSFGGKYDGYNDPVPAAGACTSPLGSPKKKKPAAGLDDEDDDSPVPPTADATLETEFLVVGGGVSGLTSAAMLLEVNHQRQVTVLEAYSDVGGCIRDVTFSQEDGFIPVKTLDGMARKYNAPAVPAGCIRIPPEHDALVKLAKTLNVEWNEATYSNCAVVNGERVRCDDIGFAFSWPENANEAQYCRFVGDFESVDRVRYDEFSQQDTGNETNFFPRQGLSEINRKLVDIIHKDGGHIEVNAKVLSSQWSPETKRYTVYVSLVPSLASPSTQFQPESTAAPLTVKYVCEHLVFAIPPRFFEDMTGPIPKLMRTQPFVRECKAIKATTVAMWFKTRWWGHLPFHRIWDRKSPLIHLELFNDPHKCSANAIRVSFADGSSFDTWGSPERGSIAEGEEPPQSPIREGAAHDLHRANYSTVNPVVVERIVAALKDMFYDCNVEYPIHTHMELFGSAWHFEHTNATVSIYEKQELAADLNEVARPDILGESCYLVGEAYNPQRAWIVAALDSIQLSLMPRFVLPYCSAQSHANANSNANSNSNQKSSGEAPRFLLGTSIPPIHKSASARQNLSSTSSEGSSGLHATTSSSGSSDNKKQHPFQQGSRGTSPLPLSYDNSGNPLESNNKASSSSSATRSSSSPSPATTAGMA